MLAVEGFFEALLPAEVLLVDFLPVDFLPVDFLPVDFLAAFVAGDFFDVRLLLTGDDDLAADRFFVGDLLAALVPFFAVAFFAVVFFAALPLPAFFATAMLSTRLG